MKVEHGDRRKILTYYSVLRARVSIWSPHIGEKATTVQELDNECDQCAVAVLEQETCCVVGHIPREIARECYFFLRRGRLGAGEVMSSRYPLAR